MKPKRLIATTGVAAEYLPPDGPERDELLGLVRLGLRFRNQQSGGHPGFLRRYVEALVARQPGRMSFDDLLLQLRLEARRRDLLGESESHVEKVDTEFELLSIHDPKRGRRQVAFKTLKNLLSIVQKDFPDPP